jgi:hypothetical protein
VHNLFPTFHYLPAAANMQTNSFFSYQYIKKVLSLFGLALCFLFVRVGGFIGVAKDKRKSSKKPANHKSAKRLTL